MAQMADRSQVLHLILSWSSVLSWLLFAVNMCLIGFLALRAHRDGKSQSCGLKRYTTDEHHVAATLERFEVPFIGRLASSFVDSE